MKKLSPEACHEYWTETVNNIGSLNHPIFYAAKPTTILDFLVQFWSSYTSKTDNILEIGCNCGANLNYLYKQGYKNLSGIEINKTAIKEMKRLYPDTYTNTNIHIGSIEDTTKIILDKTYDTTFSMAVLMHIHPQNIKQVFTELKRITRKYIVTIENENSALSNITFIRNYKKEFKKIGIEELKSIILSECIIQNIHTEYRGYTARLFKVD